jgi:hypothetical protein
MRDDEEFFRQIAMQEIVCPCGEDCLDAKGKWIVEPKTKATKKTGNPMITKHKALTDLNECMATYVIGLHKRWLQNEMVKIKLASEAKNASYSLNKISTVLKSPEVLSAMEKVVAKLGFHKFSHPKEITEAASDLFGKIWEEVSLVMPK